MLRRAFTLVELLVVIAIIGVLIGLLLPAVQAARASARRTQCTNNIKQLSLAVLNYYDAKKRFPVYGYEETGWTCVIMPFMEETKTNQDMQVRINHEESTASARAVQMFMCPDHPVTGGAGKSALYGKPPYNYGVRGLTCYVAVPGKLKSERDLPDGESGVLGGWVRGNTGVNMRMITDGTSKSFIIGERPAGPGESCDWGWWSGRNDWDIIMYPSVVLRDVPPSRISGQRYCNFPAVYGPGDLDYYCDQDHFWSLHTGGANWAMADGSVHFISYEVSQTIVEQLSTRSGGETVMKTW